MHEIRFYLTDADFETAKKNGINKELAKSRVYVHGWSVERAITQPHLSKIKSRDALNRAIANGIKPDTFWSRLRSGWDEEKAITTPTQGINSKLDPDDVELASLYGVSRQTLLRRINKGWDLESAITTPPIKPGERKNFGMTLKGELKAQ